ncbi:MAG TPA: sulfatase [Chthoniobacterales bacterium]|nr:sulfatase [Chthoniobacterales bacterium]
MHASGWLAFVLLAAKALTWNKPWLPNIHERLLELLMSSWTDVAFALACGLVGEGFARGLGRVGRATFLLFAALCAVYGAAAVGLFGYFNRPLTFQMLTLVGNADAVRSSVTQRLTTGTALALVLAPVMFLVLAFVFRRTTRLLVVLTLWALAGCILQRNFWKEDRLTEVWRSPHFELLRTAAVHLAGGRRPSFPKDFPPEYVDEFRTFRARGASANFFQPPAGVARPRNVIVVVLESVGTKYLRLYGSPLDVMPHLEAEARHALVFDNIYAHASFSYAAFRSITFGVYAGLPWHYALLGERPLPGTLAGALRVRGARTAFINNGVIHWEDLSWLLMRSNAFEVMHDYSTIGCPPLTSWGTEDKCVFDRLIQWIDEQLGAPFFAICWTDQTHDPYLLGPGVTAVDFFAGQPPPPFAKDLNAYLNVMHETDRQLGRMFDALRERGLAEDTLVVLTGDHGEAFADPHQQRGHAWSVYEEEVRVPLMFWNPRLFPNGDRIGTIGGHVDMNPTIVDLLGIDPDPEWQGHSLFDPAKPNRAYFMAIAGGDVFGVREGAWKYIYDVTSGRESLFNLASDQDERRNLSAIEPSRAVDLRKRVAAWVTFEDAFLWGREN